MDSLRPSEAPPARTERARSTLADYFKDGSIRLPSLPNQPIEITGIFIDIGGSLAKVAFYTRHWRNAFAQDLEISRRTSDEEDPSLPTDINVGRLHFVKFSTDAVDQLVQFIKTKLFAINRLDTITATGGGAYKYFQYLEEQLGVRVEQEDEMACAVEGCNFLLRKISDEAFTYFSDDVPQYKFQRLGEDIYPYMLVNIGSGVSFIKVTGHNGYERVGGTSIGGGTFLGIASLLTDASGFDDVLELCSRGHSQNIDMLVSDIYSSDYEKIGLKGSVIASSFGKAKRPALHAEKREFKQEDIAKSLLHMISNNIGQLAFLYAQLHQLKRIYFGGYFIRNHPYTMHAISFAIRFWSKGEISAMFLRHEGYLGAVGAFVKHCGRIERKHSWDENFAAEGYSWLNPVALDIMPTEVAVFPLLKDPARYVPDTVDLNEDNELRDFWISYFQKNLDKTVQRLIASEGGRDGAEKQGKMYETRMLQILASLRAMPNAFGDLSVRVLFDISAQCQRECGFFRDAWAATKEEETTAAIHALSPLLATHGAMGLRDRQVAIARGLLAGNIFDWGAPEVEKLMREGVLDFQAAMERVPPRPWLIDGLDAWIERLENGPVHAKAVVFVDNMGADLILGVMPLVAELLARGTLVVIGANETPVLNDVTVGELQSVLDTLRCDWPELDTALKYGFVGDEDCTS